MGGIAGVLRSEKDEEQLWVTSGREPAIVPADAGCEVPDRHDQMPEWQQACRLELVGKVARNRPVLLLHSGPSPKRWVEALPAGSQVLELSKLGTLSLAALRGRSVLVECEPQQLDPQLFEHLRLAKVDSVLILRMTRVLRVLIAPRSPKDERLASIRCGLRAGLVKLLTKPLSGTGSFASSAFIREGFGYSACVGDVAGSSDCIVFEDAVPLMWPGADLGSVASLGLGRHLRCGERIHFSASDNSNPNNNGRSYRLLVQRGWRWQMLRWMLGMKNGEPFFMPENLRRLGALGAQTVCRLPMRRGMKVIGSALKRHPFETAKPKDSRVLLFTSHLKAGGAERQMCNLARHLQLKGMQPSVLIMEHESGTGCYAPMLGTMDRGTCDRPSGAFHFGSFARMPSLKRQAFFALPRNLQWRVWNAYTHLAVYKPDVLHCFLDRPNIVGALAGWMAGVPKVVLSIRNLRPGGLGGHEEWIELYRRFYSLLGNDPAVVITANSLEGIRDYGRWCGFDQDRVLLTRNIVDLEVFRPLEEVTRCRARQSLGLSETAPVLTGVFRMTYEKAPIRFLDVVERVAAILPRLTVLVCGEGKLTEPFCAAIRKRELQHRVRYLGVRSDIREIIGASDMLLLTSETEGTANVLLEAQALQVPVVATDVGGSSEAVQDGVTGFLRKPGNIDGLVSACLLLLQEPLLREQFGRAGRAFIESNFSAGTAVEQLRTIYGLR